LFESRVLRRVFNNTREEVTGEWRRRHDFYSSPKKIRVIKSICVGLTRHVARMGGRKLNSGFCWDSLKKDTMKEQGEDWRKH
jgi:hypothetical protein